MRQTADNISGTASMSAMQTTIQTPITMSGVGVHSGRHAVITLHPAVADTGILFHRVDIEGDDGFVLTHASNAIEAQLCTTIKNHAKTEVRMVEHLMAAFHGLGIDNIIVEIDGPEVPILDGSSAMIVEAINHAGIMATDSPRTYIEIIAPVKVELGNGAWASLSPAPLFSLMLILIFLTLALASNNLPSTAKMTAFKMKLQARAHSAC